LLPTESGANQKFKLPHFQAETPMRIRTAVTADEAQRRELWPGYTQFYETHPPENVTATTWRQIVTPQPAIPCRFAEQEGRLLGFSHSPPHEGTFIQAPICYLEDLFVDPAARGVAGFGAWLAPRGEGPILPIEPCDGKSTRQRRSPSLYRIILWSGDRTWETPKS
jgi:hypothetical protein